ncbi:Ribokinase [Linderina pennispora]|uniref:Ribokinase n=1 Tax=Linderina pennispora TaxID=61395 RepID=A0A1Y1VZZ2_9FUNG|nr:Ribokinase [Linderina pennispora]ORX66837.1 Ribokinase [Linderina pennispora]
MQPRIVSFASINIDEVYSVPHIVKPGETISATHRQENAGGKGANASVAAARAGGDVYVTGRIGKDGLWVRDLIRDSGAHTGLIQVTNSATGRAIIQVDKHGENCIFLFPGANMELTEEDARIAYAQFGKGDWLVLPNETSAVAGAIRQASSRGMQVLWNPAPMTNDVLECPVELVDVLVVNETELTTMTRLIGEAVDEDYPRMARRIIEKFNTRVVVVTLGSSGCIGLLSVPCAPIPKDKVADTTAAGDTWVGYFVAELARQQGVSPESIGSKASLTPAIVQQAMTVATFASGLSVTKKGAVPSIPVRADVDQFMKSKQL